MQPKHFLYLLFVLVLSSRVHDAVAQVPFQPANHTNANKSYVRTWDVVAPTASSSNLSLSTNPQTAILTTLYVDGLGRPGQTVVKQGSKISGGNAVDLVSAVVYDPFGRQSFQYLPFAATQVTGATGSLTDGSFKLNAFTQQAEFYNSANQANPIAGQDETFFYSESRFEPSPLNRVVKALAPGDSWIRSDRGVNVKYHINTEIDAVRKWTVNDGIGSFGSYTSTATYPAGELYKTITEDEEGSQVIEFKDKEGKIVLKKIQLTATSDGGSGKDHTGWLATYYIYDNLNQLRCVVQPRGVELIAPSWVLTDATILAEQCFRYEYDGRGRMVIKKVPGAAEVQTVYDARDRLVMTQDGNLRTGGKWFYTEYDLLNRPVATGLITDGSTHATHRSNAAASTSYPNLNNYTEEELTRNFYDNYNWRTSFSNPLSASFNNSYSSYYVAASTTTYPFAEIPAQSSALKGMVTGSRTKALGTSTYLYAVNFYDDKGRLIQVQSTNITGGIDISTIQYSFSGQPMISIVKREKSGIGALTVVVATKNTYDDLGRTEKIEKNINNTGWKVISRMEYDGLGQLKTKNLGIKPNSADPLEKLTYEYNIRGWMLGMNRSYLSGADAARKFGFELAYDKKKSFYDGYTAITYTKEQYNGNIGGMMWRSAGDGEKRKNDFDYDAVNRLLKADFNQHEGGATWGITAGVNFSMGGDPLSGGTMKYDANGNILEIWQKGLKIGTSDYIDKLSYAYYDNTNKLKTVSDPVSEQKLGDFTDKNTSGDDYGYDKNGNMITDLNKKMGTSTGVDLTSGGAITYNHLNLPHIISLKNDDNTTKGTITYTYDAVGNKLKKVTVENAGSNNGNIQITTTTTYIGGFVYENKVHFPSQVGDYTDQLQFIAHEEGRIREKLDGNNNVTGYNFDYFIKDHLGNVRMVLTDEAKQDIYPAATLETTGLAVEKQYYDIVDGERPLKSNVFGFTNASGSNYPNNNNNNNPVNNNPTSNTSAESQRLYRMNGEDGVRVGLGITLKVMSGDNINILAKSYFYSNSVDHDNTFTLMVNNLLTSFVGTPAIAGKGVSSTVLTSSTNITGAASSVLNNVPTPPNNPKAYINWILFDEQFKAIASNSSFDPVGSSGVIKDHFKSVDISKNGYLYVYCSNESGTDVFFDNFQVVHNRGAVLEETHYYPFGLTMSGISSKAASMTPNKENTFQNQRFDDDLGLNWVQFKWRNHDPQIGRFIEIDPLADDYVYNSTYAFSENRVINAVELEGLEAVLITNIYDKDNKLTGTSTINNKEDNYGPLGNGTYTVNKKADGTFSEEFKPGEGNSVNGFYQEGISQSRWIEGDKQGGYSTRLGARLIEKTVEDGLVAMGFNIGEVQKDVTVLETDDKSFKGKFAAFSSSDAINKYTRGWESSTPSSPHKSNSSYESGQLFTSDVGIKVYDGAKSQIDNIRTHIGLVRKGGFDHRSEALDAVLFPNAVNIGLRNASRVKSNQEKRQ